MLSYVQSNWDEVVDNFDDMSLKEDLLRGVYAYGFEKPSAIQQRAIIPCVKGFDVIAQAQSGTGKTATFAVAILQKLDVTLKECQALVLAPTRELAQQVSLDCRVLRPISIALSRREPGRGPGFATRFMSCDKFVRGCDQVRNTLLRHSSSMSRTWSRIQKSLVHDLVVNPGLQPGLKLDSVMEIGIYETCTLHTHAPF